MTYIEIAVWYLKANSYIAQYPVLKTGQSAIHFTSLTDLFTQTSSRFLWEASSHMLHLMREGCSYTYPPLSIARYSFIQLSELEQCRVKTCPRLTLHIGDNVLIGFLNQYTCLNCYVVNPGCLYSSPSQLLSSKANTTLGSIWCQMRYYVH